MSNGEQCCALEICCSPAQRRLRLTAAISAFTGAEMDYCEKFLDWMAHEDLIFAPKELQPALERIATIARAHPPQVV
jgi:hypothetical protein